MPIRPLSMTFFFIVHLFYKYVQSNQLNTRDRKKLSQQEETFFSLIIFSFSARVSFCPLNKKSIVH